MYVIENTDGKIVKEMSEATGELIAEDITMHFAINSGEVHYLLKNGIVIYTAYPSGFEEWSDDTSMWDDENDYEDIDDYDSTDDYYDNYNYDNDDPFDEVGYNPYTGGYDSDC